MRGVMDLPEKEEEKASEDLMPTAKQEEVAEMKDRVDHTLAMIEGSLTKEETNETVE